MAKRDEKLYDRLRKGGVKKKVATRVSEALPRKGRRSRPRQNALRTSSLLRRSQSETAPVVALASVRTRPKSGSDSKGERRQTPERSSQTQTQGSQELDSPF